MRMGTVLGAALSVAASLTSSGADAQTNYRLRCRGLLNLAVGTGQQTTVVFFAKNASSSGDAGIALQPGTCAWVDRAVSASEPSKIYVKPQTTTGLRASFVALSPCAANARCVAEFLAHNANDSGDPHFRVDDGYVRIYWPAFP